MASLTPDLRAKFKHVIAFKIYIVGLIVIALFLDFLVVAFISIFVSILHKLIMYLGAAEDSAIELIMNASGAVYILIYFLLAIMFLITIYKEIKEH